MHYRSRGRQSELELAELGPMLKLNHCCIIGSLEVILRNLREGTSSWLIADKLMYTGHCYLGDLEWVERKMLLQRRDEVEK